MDYENTYTENVDYSELMKLSLTEYDSFSLVWRPDFKYNENSKTLENNLEPHLIKSKKANKWPGTEVWGSPATVNFYEVNKKSITLLSNVGSITNWQAPNHPEDLAFYKNGEVKFASVGHEGMAWHEKPNK